MIMRRITTMRRTSTGVIIGGVGSAGKFAAVFLSGGGGGCRDGGVCGVRGAGGCGRGLGLWWRWWPYHGGDDDSTGTSIVLRRWGIVDIGTDMLEAEIGGEGGAYLLHHTALTRFHPHRHHCHVQEEDATFHW